MTSDLERAARAIASELGHDYDAMLRDKSDWIARGGADANGYYWDVNVPFRSDVDAAARAALEALLEPSEGVRNFILAHTDCESAEEAAEFWQAALSHILDQKREG